MNWKLIWGRMSPITMIGVVTAGAGTLASTLGSILQNVMRGSDAEVGVAVHQGGMVFMLVGGLMILASLMQKRGQVYRRISSFEAKERFWLTPLEEFECLIIKPEESFLDVLKRVPRGTRMRIRAILAANCTLDEDGLEILAIFPNLAVIDLQGCKLEESSLDYLSDVRELRHLFLANAVSAERVKVL